jgi:hypothetical protein
MKTPIIFKKRFAILTIVLFGLAISNPAVLAQAQPGKLRVGVYDSRAVAVAWGNSTEFKEFMKPIEAEHKKAKEAKNEKRTKEIEEQMKARQHRAHEQAFGTGSVAPIMEKIKDRLPAVAKEANVQIIVSKWELNHQTTEVEVVDVTDKLVALFHVSERGLQWCKDIQGQKPLPIEQISEHME